MKYFQINGIIICTRNDDDNNQILFSKINKENKIENIYDIQIKEEEFREISLFFKKEENKGYKDFDKTKIIKIFEYEEYLILVTRKKINSKVDKNFYNCPCCNGQCNQDIEEIIQTNYLLVSIIKYRKNMKKIRKIYWNN